MIIAIEGIDGAGKNTLTRSLKAALGEAVSTLGFPQYDTSIPAQLAHEALYGRMGDLTSSAYAMATLFALDRHSALDKLRSAHEDSSTVLLLDRYVASNAAYSAARLGDDSVMDWVYDLEFGRLGLPLPDLQIYLDTDVNIAAQRAQKRAQQDSSRSIDEYEKNDSLQQDTAAAYRRLVQRNWASQWIAGDDPDKISHAVREFLTF